MYYKRDWYVFLTTRKVELLLGEVEEMFDQLME